VGVAIATLGAGDPCRRQSRKPRGHSLPNAVLRP
jgi:hypothetical protein